MKKLQTLLIGLCLFVVAAPVLAEPKEKSVILHCGCTWDGVYAGMAYGENTVSAKSRGHDAHLVATVDSCYNGEVETSPGVFGPSFADFVRNGDDCQLSGPSLGDPILDCEGFAPEPIAGDACGTAVID